MKTTFFRRFLNLFITRLIFLRFFLLMMLNPFAASATHISGADITYKWLSGNTYQLSLTLYRDCAGIAAPNTAGVTYSSVSCGQNLTVNLTKVAGTGQEISHTCSTAVTTCRGGSLAGIQKYEYVGNVTLPANCSDWIFGYAICCRNCAITTLSYTPNNCNGVPGTYVEATLNNLAVPNNSAPSFTNIPVAFFCMGQTFHYNHGAYDVDGDSLVYSFVTPRSAPNTYVTFKPGYSASSPLTSSPAISLDNSGDISITPTALEVGVMTILVKEYRNGVLIGSVLRDMEVYTQSCNNVLPTASGINGSNNYDLIACPGKPINFTINTGDGNSNQTVTITCVSPIPGSSFTNTTGQHPTGTFSWTPSVGQARSQPYSFIITVQDDNCPYTGFQTYSYTIKVPPLTTAMQTTNATCALPANGSASVTAVGTGPYQYLWNPGGSTGTSITGLGAGNYSVVVTDSYGCTSSVSGNLLSPAPIISSPTITNVNCFGRNNGSISLSTAGGVSPYSYVWTPSYPNSATLNNLTPGTYSCVITDANGCTKTASASVTQPTVLASSISPPTNVICNGGNNGSASVVASGGTSPYQYTWSPTSSTTSSINNLIAGTYQATVTDSKGCSTTSTVSITQPSPLTISTTSNATTCGNNNGSLNSSGAGGVGPYTYLWTPGNIASAAANGLAPGSYTVRITDANGCTTTATANVNALPLPVVSIASVANVTCNGGNNGSASVNVNGGLSPYTYVWTGSSSTTNSVNNVTAGNYSVIATDARGCTTSISTAITQPTIVQIASSTISSTCGNANGSIDLTVSGGVSPYNYSWASAPGVNSQHLGNISAGSYSAIITDANGCTMNSTIPLSNIGGPQASMSATQNVRCYGNSDGSASVAVSGGTGPFNYAWSCSALNTNSISNISAGSYSVIITDANNCISTVPFSISQPVVLATSLTSTNVNCFGASTGSAAVTGSGGTSPYQYSWLQTGATTASINNIPSGTYQVTVTDVNGCTASSSTSISQPSAINLNASATATTCNTNNGSVQATAVGGTPPYNYVWMPGNRLNYEYTGIGPGNYSVTVTDANGCTSAMSASVVATPTPTVSISSSNNVSCNAGTNGNATVLASSGVGPYNYLWSPSGGTNSTANQLSAGSYSVRVTDANGCTVSVPVVISQPSSLAMTPTVGMGTCGSNNGSASVTVSGGSTPYSYSWSNGVTGTNSITGLAAGVYRVVTTDLNGCTLASSINVPNSGNMAASVSSLSMPNCYGQANATATVAVSGGTGPFTYAWQPNVSATGVATGLTNGRYDVTVTDANNCIAIANVIVDQPPQILISTSATQNARCYNSATGQAQVSVNGGTPPYSFQWIGYSNTDSILPNVPAGLYSAIVTDSHGCTSDADAVVGEPTQLQLNSSTISSTCGNSNAAIDVTINGGMNPYSIAWTTFPSNTSNYLGSIGAGTYQVNVTDANSCTTSQSIIVSNIGGPQANISAIQNVACYGGSNGSASVTVTGGTTPMTYQWSGSSESTSSLTNVVAGNYSVQITDGNGCTTSVPFAITQPSVLTSSTTSSNVNCFGGANGSASVIANGGVSPYQYSWNQNSLTTSTINNLSAGNYIATVTDVNGCTSTSSISVSQPVALNISAASIPSYCGINNGSAQANVSGGTTPYSYLWTPGNNTSASYYNLNAGSYSVTITDGNGCTASENTTVAGFPSPVATIASSTNVFCNGGANGSATATVSNGTGPFSYTWSPIGGNAISATQLSAGVYSVNVRDANGCTSNASVQITEPAIMNVSPSTTMGTCSTNNGSASVAVIGGQAPYSYAWSNGINGSNMITSLAPGNYSVVITDANGCTQTSSMAVQNSGAVNSAVSTTTSPNCFGDANGTASISVSGGSAPYFYSWSPNISNANVATGLTNGQYSVTVTDANQCSSTTNITINQPTQMVLSTSTSSNVLCYGSNSGQAQVVANGGVTPYTYQWSGSSDVDNTLENSYAGTYSVVVTDSHGCTSLASVTVSEPTQISITPTTVSATCGNRNGSIDVSVGGGISPYVYSWSVPGVGNVSHLGNIGAGSYQVNVTDANGCIQPMPIGLSNVGGPIVSLGALTNVTCYGSANGSASVNLSGGTAPFTYSWSCSNQNASSVSNIPAGSHTVVISDGNNCFTAVPFNITQPARLISSASSTDASCYGGNSGSAIVVASGGVSPYSYAWSNGQTGVSASSLISGNYSVVVTDSHGCNSTASVYIAQPTSINIVSSPVDVNCYDSTDGSILINASGGVGPYDYQWSSGQNTQYIDNLSAGTYSAMITDANGCTYSQSIIVNQPGILDALSTIIPVTCYAGSDGQINLEVNGGVPPYNYNWNPSAINSPNISNLFANNYEVTITDDHGCSFTSTYTVESPTEILTPISTQNLKCYHDASGSATINATGGVSPLNYQWSIGNSTPTINNLNAGSYYVTVTDAHGCTKTKQVILYEPTELVASTTTPSILCIGQSASITASASGGTPQYNYVWNGVDVGPTMTFSPTQTSYYSVVAIDSNGCRTSAISVQVPVHPPLMISSAPSDTICEGDYSTVFVNVQGGNGGPYQYNWNTGSTDNYLYVHPTSSQLYTVQISDNCGTPPASNQVLVYVNPKPNSEFAPFPISGCPDLSVNFTLPISVAPIVSSTWDYGDGATSTSFNQTHIYTTPGVYTVTHSVISNMGCASVYVAPASVFVFGTPTADFSVSTDNPTIINPNVEFSDLSIDPVYWNWNFGDGDSSLSTNPNHMYRDTGIYIVRLIVHNSKMCYDTTYKPIRIKDEFTIYFPNAFTPNDDGVNEEFKPLALGVKEFKMLIFDRWGLVIYTTSDIEKGWNGTMIGTGKECQMDTYVYMAIATAENGKKKEFIGHVNLVR